MKKYFWVLKNMRNAEEIMKTDFFPPSPTFEDIIMQQVYKESAAEQLSDAPTGFSLRGWVLIGFFVLFSLSSAFFGMDFAEIANSEGLSFLLPMGLTIGIMLTVYGALFIGSHLKALSDRFGLR
ncbi:MAG: peptidoglycan-binding protein [Treponema sp.]|nr:peptidoglycan-binding protein [Treponema sp.]